MTMTVHIPDRIGIQIREHVLHHHIDAARNLLWEAVKPMIEMFSNHDTPTRLSDNEFECLADQLADEFASYITPNCVPLSDYALTREGIYAEHL